MDAVPAGEAHDSARGGGESALSQTASHPLTQTSMTSVGGLRAFDTALRVNDTGEIRIDDHVARVSMGASAGEREILPLPLELAQDHHLFWMMSLKRLPFPLGTRPTGWLPDVCTFAGERSCPAPGLFPLMFEANLAWVRI